MKAPLYSKEGKKKSEVVLNPKVFGVRVNQRLLNLVRNGYAANLRSGTAHTKTRGNVSGGGKKPWRQKGTGRARAGSTRSPLWRGGGTIFGPLTRDYSVHLSKSMRLAALASALSSKALDKKLVVLEEVKLASPKTKEWVELVKAQPLDGRRALCVVKEANENIRRASRNMREWVEVKEARNFTAYDVLQRDRLMIDQDALAVIDQRIVGEK
jgi:large subunit ribosomal protein L4